MSEYSEYFKNISPISTASDLGFILDSKLEIFKPTENSLIQLAELMRPNRFEISDQDIFTELMELDESEISDQELDEFEPLNQSPLIVSELENLDSTELLLLTEPVELVTGSYFPSWLIAEHYVKEHGRQRGFAINRYRVSYYKNSNSSNQIMKKRTLSCKHAGIHKPKKTKLLDQQYNKELKKTNCKWYVNLSKPNNSSFVHVTCVQLEHNHELLVDNAKFATRFRKFDQPILAEIEHAVNLSNAIQKIKYDRQITGSDASQLLKFLLNQQKEELLIFVQPLINTNSCEPKGILTDMDLAIEAVCKHMSQNLPKRLKAKLRTANFKQFICDFWKMHNALCVDVFEQQFQALLKTYSSINRYLQDPLYSTRSTMSDDQNESYENLITTDNSEDIKDIEDYYNYQQIYLKSPLNSVERNSVKEIWQIVPYMIPSSYQHIIILNDGTHLYTCLLLVSNKIVCYYYFKLMIKSQNALFHPLQMPTRWLRDEVWTSVDFIFKELFIETSSKNLNQDIFQQTNLLLDIIIMFKKFRLKDNDQSGLDDIILAYISEKVAKLNNKIQLERENVFNKDINSNNIIKLPDSHVYNVDDIKDLTKYKVKSSNVVQKEIIYEELENAVSSSSDNTSGYKCRLYNKTGHYAPRCP
ncbi:15906_t:CDS:10, partial [Dentiscutata erythropus]